MNVRVLTNLLVIGTGVMLLAGVVMMSFAARPMAEQAQIQEMLRNAREDLDEGNFQGAMRNLTAAQKAAPNRPDIRKALAEAYLANNQPLQAMQELKKAVEIAPNDYDINEAYGDALEDLESPQAALAFYSEMITKFPSQLAPRARAAEVHEEMGQPKLAEKLWEEATKTDKDDDTAWVRWGQLVAATGDLEGAKKVFQKGIEQQPGSALLHFNLGALLSVTGKEKEALQELHTAGQLDGEFKQLLDQIGIAGDATRVSPLHVVTLRENADGAFYVPSVLDKAVLARLIVDQNVALSVVSTPLAKRLKVDTIKSPPVSYKKASAPDCKATFTLNSVKVATATVNNLPAAVFNPAGSERNTPKDGLLGMNYLDRFKFHIDGHHQQLILVTR